MATISKLGRRERQGRTTQEREAEGADRGLVLREGNYWEQREKHRRHGVPSASGVSARARNDAATFTYLLCIHALAGQDLHTPALVWLFSPFRFQFPNSHDKKSCN